MSSTRLSSWTPVSTRPPSGPPARRWPPPWPRPSPGTGPGQHDMTARPGAGERHDNSTVTATPEPATASTAGLTPAAAWSSRVRRVGGFIQLAFAAFWLVRGSLAIGGGAGAVLPGAPPSRYRRVRLRVRATAGPAARPAGPRPNASSGPLRRRSSNWWPPSCCPSSSSSPATPTGSCRPSLSPSGRCCSGSTISSTSPVPSRGLGVTVGPFILVATMSGPPSPPPRARPPIVLLGTAAAGFRRLRARSSPRPCRWRHQPLSTSG